MKNLLNLILSMNFYDPKLWNFKHWLIWCQRMNRKKRSRRSRKVTNHHHLLTWDKLGTNKLGELRMTFDEMYAAYTTFFFNAVNAITKKRRCLFKRSWIMTRVNVRRYETVPGTRNRKTWRVTLRGTKQLQQIAVQNKKQSLKTPTHERFWERWQDNAKAE
jgi:hypothetical protein